MGDLISLPFTNFPELVGVYAVEDDDLLYRDAPHNEWRAYYRKASLPPLEPSLDSVMRLELVPFQEDSLDHSSCGKGITDKAEIEAILTEIRAQGPCKQSELYDLVEKPDGFLENCYGYGRIYAFLADEPNLAIAMYITSYNDLAYSISIEEKEYLLTEKLLNRLLAANK